MTELTKKCANAAKPATKVLHGVAFQGYDRLAPRPRAAFAADAAAPALGCYVAAPVGAKEPDTLACNRRI